MDLTVDGHPAFAGTGGRAFDPGEPTVTFVHGAGMDHTVWALPARYFAHHGRAVLAPDLPGHGRSGGVPLESVEQMAAWLERLLDAAAVSETAVVGHSMGAAVALELAAAAPQRVRALALVGSAPRLPVNPDLLQAARAGDPMARDLIADWALSRTAHLGGSPAPGLWMTGGTQQLLAAEPDGVLAADLAASDAYEGAVAAAAAVTCPTIIVVGGDDRMTPARHGSRLADLIDGAEIEVIAGSGHLLMTEAPDATLDALRRVV